MKLYDTTLPHQSLIHEIWSLCDADVNSYPLKDVVRRINAAGEELVGDIINADGTWQWDDTNYGNFPVGTYTLVASQSKYSFNDKFLQLAEVQVMDVNGKYHIIPSIDQSEIETETPLERTYETAGWPIYYDKIADDTIKLLPAPDNGVTVTLASGLKIKFKRTFRLFTMSDSTTITSGEEAYEPGLPSPYHILMAYMAAIPFCMNYKKDRVALYEKKVMELKPKLLRHYSQRERDVRKVITNEDISYR